MYVLLVSYFFIASCAKDDALKNTLETLSDNLEKLEPQIISTATSLAKIDSNINNLQERAHVWDTFQLHVSAWNEQLAILDRKIDILNKGQEKLFELESKLGALTNIEYKIDDTLSLLKSKTRDVHLGEKLEKMLSRQKVLIKIEGGNTKPKLIMKCKAPRLVEEFLKDISSKVDIIFDKVVEGDDYEAKPLRTTRDVFQNRNIQEKLLEKMLDIENISLTILKRVEKNCGNSFDTFHRSFKSGCDELNNAYTSGVYVFGNSSENNYNRRFCEIREDVWTVIQRRNNFSSLQNFNLSWNDYKYGFGDLTKDFWFGNDFISKLTNEKFLILRIELEDFDGNHVWAEYSKFLVLPEENNYRVIIGKYRGNSSDSFSSHNGSFFSTFDRKNDEAPDCCPCAVSYGGGWWFNSCFESNLNGVYHGAGVDNGHFGGIIWEKWLGDYSLKKTLMMVKPVTSWP